jgi:hypothetical protein
MATEGPSDHGFIVTIQGYCPDVAGLEPYDVAQVYVQTLLSRQPLAKATDPNTMYYFTDFTLSGLPVPAPLPGAVGQGTGAATNTGPWGKNAGPYREIYAVELSGYKPDPKPIVNPTDPNANQPNPVLTGDFGGPIDAFVRDPSKGIKYMYNYYQFTIQFKVHVK